MTIVNNMQYKRIVVTEKNYRELKGLGSAGDSFNDVITAMLEKLKGLQQSTGVPAPKIVVNSEHFSKENCHE
jgi:predicted CopG family antitoxin